MKPEVYKNGKYAEKRQDIAQKEAEAFTNEYIKNLKNTKDDSINKRMIKIQKVFAILLAIAGVLSLYILFKLLV